MIRSLNIWLSAGFFLVALLVTGTLRAQETRRVGIVKFEGQSASAIQAQVTQGLKQSDRIELVSSREVASTASRLGNSLRSDSDYQEVGEALELSAFIEGTSEKERRGRDLIIVVRVRDASTGEVIHEQTWKKRRSQVKTLRSAAWDKLGPPISQTSAPSGKRKPSKQKPVAEVEPEEEEESEEEVEETPPPRTRPRREVQHEEAEAGEEEEQEDEPARAIKRSAKHPALVLYLGPRLMWRTLKYATQTNLNSYSNDGGSPAFNLALGARWFPGAHTSTGWYSNLGLDFDLDYSMGLKSKLPRGGGTVGTKAYELGVGALYRVRLGDFEPFLRIGYVKHVFAVDVPQTEILPKLDYNAVRFGLGTSVGFVDWLAIDASFAYLIVLGTGELEDYVEKGDVSTSAWEANAGVTIRFKEVYGIRLGLDYRRYKYDFGNSYNDPSMTSTMTPGLPNSGTDSYFRLGLTFVYTLPGAAK